jgi:hypothetical protein
MAPARIIIEWTEDDPAARVERWTPLVHALAALIPGARVRGDWGACPSRDGIARGGEGGWPCQLAAGHDGLHQHEKVNANGTHVLWVWSSDGAYYTFMPHTAPHEEGAMPEQSTSVPSGGPPSA